MINTPVNANLNRLRVLCADANSNMRSIYRTLLLGMGVGDVITADDGAVAYEQYRAYRPDAVIIELTLPMISGLELVKMIRTRPDSPSRHVPIIVCTADATRQSILVARDLGVTEFLAKPISGKSLQERLETVVSNPRPFVDTGAFVGPDRRRGRTGGEYRGPDRRERRGDRPSSPPSARPAAPEASQQEKAP